MTLDTAPVFPEFGPGATTCDGDMTGCAVCSTASVGARFGEAIPRRTDGTPDMRALGYRMGKRHRDADSRVRHGLSLNGSCTPPHSGTNWCAFCAHLQFKAWGLPSLYTDLSDSALESHLRANHPMVVPGLYSRVPIVSKTSYSATVPARGRSDTGFGGTHMVAAFGLTFGTGGRIVNVIVADPDFGSSSRPVVPPHSLWPWQVFLNYRHALGWGIAVVNAKPAGLVIPPKPPTINYEATVRPENGEYYAYEVVETPDHPNGTIRRRALRETNGFQAKCSPAVSYLFAAEHSHVELVQIMEGGYGPHNGRPGRFISRNWSNQP